jgi:hypothetical protein
MKKHLLILSLIFCSAMHWGFAQVTFQKSIGNGAISYSNSVLQTMDSGYVSAGATVSIYSTMYLIKTNSIGNLLWTRSYTYFALPYAASDIQQTYDSGYIVTGLHYSNAQGGSFLYLIKTDANGDTLWTKIYSQGFRRYYAYSVQQTSDSGYIIAGAGANSFNANSKDSINAFLFKIGPNGAIHWLKAYDCFNHNEAKCVRQTTDNGYIIVGYKKNTGIDSADIYLVKTNTTGDTLWTRAYGGADNDYGNSVRQTNDGGYIIIGSTKSFGSGNSDVYLIKTDSSGNVQWSKTFGGTADDIGYSVQLTTDGGYIVSGSTYSYGNNGAYLIKTDSQGILEWSKAIVGANALSVKQTMDNGYIAGGMVYTGSGAYILFVKTDSLGNTECNEIDPVTITTTPATQQSHTSTNIFIPGINYFTGSQPITIGSGGSDTTLCTTVGINKTQARALFNIFPNPATNTLTIETPTKATIEIINIQGQIIKTLKTSEGITHVDVSALPGGVYIIKLNTGEGSLVRKFVKQ